MFFLRFVVLIIIILGVLIYLISNRLRLEFFKIGGEKQSLLGSHSEGFKSFCENPPAERVSILLKLQKKLSIALIAAIVAFFLIILAAAL
ncbi:MAG: hypothetical protein C0623_10565 [Desulfuromonas sp.]|nr:MAG: hypothetical protein C0623_10565 [Desulfuromonas sp.]